MSLRDEIDADVAGLWIDLDDIPIHATYRQQLSTDYDPAIGVDSIYQNYSVSVVEDTITESEIQTGVAGKLDKAFLIRSPEISDTVIRPEDLVTVNSQTFVIVTALIDPAGAVWRVVCHGR